MQSAQWLLKKLHDGVRRLLAKVIRLRIGDAGFILRGWKFRLRVIVVRGGHAQLIEHRAPDVEQAAQLECVASLLDARRSWRNRFEIRIRRIAGDAVIGREVLSAYTDRSEGRLICVTRACFPIAVE